MGSSLRGSPSRRLRLGELRRRDARLLLQAGQLALLGGDCFCELGAHSLRLRTRALAQRSGLAASLLQNPRRLLASIRSHMLRHVLGGLPKASGSLHSLGALGSSLVALLFCLLPQLGRLHVHSCPFARRKH